MLGNSFPKGMRMYEKLYNFKISSKDKQVFSFLEKKQYESASKDLIESTFIELLFLLFLRWGPKSHINYSAKASRFFMN